jgi:hypothetical protein
MLTTCFTDKYLPASGRVLIPLSSASSGPRTGYFTLKAEGENHPSKRRQIMTRNAVTSQKIQIMSSTAERTSDLTKIKKNAFSACLWKKNNVPDWISVLKLWYLGALAKLLRRARLSDRPSAWNNSAPTARIFVKISISIVFFFSKICQYGSSFI